MIAVKLMGGLGNQMFQYAMGRSLSLRHRTSLKLELRELLDRSPRESDFVYRDYDLDIFADLPVAFTNRWESRGFVYRDSPLWRRIWHRAKRSLFPYHYVTEKNYLLFDPDFRRFRRNCYLEGYWGSQSYFLDYAQQIRGDFTFRVPLSPAEEDLARRLRAGASVCVNFRRTDFAWSNNATPLDFYERAVDLLKARVGDLELYIFSDEIDWCRENFRPDCPHHFVDHSYKGFKFSSYMRLMSACSHFIIPCSSFAWWSAWLNPDPNKVVIAPRDSGDLPPDWIRL